MNDKELHSFKDELDEIIKWEDSEADKKIAEEKQNGNIQSGLDAYQVELRPVRKEVERRVAELLKKYGLA